LTVAELARHLGVVALLALAHGGALAAMASIAAQRAPVFFGTSPASGTLWLVISATYAPLDLLTYISILGLAHLTDRARQAEDARRRAVTLEAVAVAARLSALKARLDPHFLYNALNAAVTLARRGQGDDTSRVLEELTALLRYVLDDSRPRVPLAEEMAFVRRYLEIMELRFGARLTFAIRVDGDANDMPVPPLILQPLVENAVEHGVANTSGQVAVRVAARRDGHRLVMTVEDDGPGPNAGSRAGAGMGLGATRERLAMLFGEAASLTLEPRAPHGAVATLALPVMTPAAS
jgi:sensor histidine kinase YesM